MTPDIRRASANADDLPYHYREDAIDFQISEYSVDETEPSEPETGDTTLPLFRYQPWDRAELSLSLTVSDRDLDHVCEGDPPYDAKLIVVAESKSTHLRYEEVVVEEDLTTGTYTKTIGLEADFLRGTVTLTPRIVTTDEVSRGLPFAPKGGMRIAGGDAWKVHVDEPEQSGTGFPFLYRDFSDGDYPEDAVHLLKRNPREPAVLVNTLNEPIVDVLETRTFYSFDAYLKKVIKAELGTSTWIQLVVHTATTVAESDEPQYEWQEGLIEEIGPYLYEDASYDEVVENLGEAVSEPAELRSFIRELNVAVQLYLEQASKLNDFIDDFRP